MKLLMLFGISMLAFSADLTTWTMSQCNHHAPVPHPSNPSDVVWVNGAGGLQEGAHYRVSLTYSTGDSTITVSKESVAKVAGTATGNSVIVIAGFTVDEVKDIQIVGTSVSPL